MDLQTQISDEEIKKFEQAVKDQHSQLLMRTNELLKKCLSLEKAGNKAKELEGAMVQLTYSLMLDSGALLSIIPGKVEMQVGVLNIRQRLIEEYDCKTAAELILVDEIVAAYWRQMKYERYASKLPESENGGYLFDQLTINALKECGRQIEQARRQIEVSLTMLKNLKQPQLKVNVKTENAYIAQNQQVINEKLADEPPVETIKPK